MPSVEAVNSDNFETVLPLLRSVSTGPDRVFSAKSDDRWRLLADYPWQTERAERGWMLVEGDEAVGFVGAIFSERMIGGRQRRFCNLASWYVRPDHRGSSLALMRPVLGLHDRTILDVSATPDVVRLSKRLGFLELDTQMRLVEPPRIGAVGRIRARTIGLADRSQDTAASGQLAATARVKVYVDDWSSARWLDAEECRVFLDHDGLPGCHRLVLVTAEGRASLVVFTHHRRGRTSYSHVQYVSDQESFLKHHEDVRRSIYLFTGSPLLIVDARFPWSEVPGSSSALHGSIRLYRPCDDLAPARIDNLYSELTMHNAARLPLGVAAVPPPVVARARRRLGQVRTRGLRRSQNDSKRAAIESPVGSRDR